MDHYDKTRSKLGNSVAAPEAGLAHATGLEEHPTCDSDIYLGYLQAPTREIINAIEGAGITRDGTVLNQLLLAIQSIAAAAAPQYTENIQTVTGGSGNTGPTAVDLSLAPFNVPASAKSVQLMGFIRENANDRGSLIRIVSGAGGTIDLSETLVNVAPSIQRTAAFVSVDPSKTITYEVLKSPASLAGNAPVFDIQMLGHQ